MPAPEYPCAFGQWQIGHRSTDCRLPGRRVRVHAPGSLLRDVLRMCDGRMAWKEVAAQLGRRWARASVEPFLNHLYAEGLLLNAGEALGAWYALAHEEAPATGSVDASDPPQSGIATSPGSHFACMLPQAMALAALLRRRRSHRTFADRPLSTEALAAILWAAHGVTVASPSERGWHRTIPSGGNMHSARWVLCMLRPGTATDGQLGVSTGMHRVNFHADEGCSFDLLDNNAALAWSFLRDPRILQFATAIVLPVSDVSVATRKYGNRAAAFAALETGASMQNAQLMATALDAGAVVRGDVVTSEVLKHLGRYLGSPQRGLIVHSALILGIPATQEETNKQQRDASHRICGLPKPDIPYASGVWQFAFSAGPIQIGGREIFSTGRSHQPAAALAKAEAEAWERRGWATLGPCVQGTMAEVAGAVDPRTLADYGSLACRSSLITPFEQTRSYLWREGVDVDTGASRRVPAEFVHALAALPEIFQRQACTISSTSGGAAWTTADEAVCRACLELIERDAFARHWITRAPPQTILLESLPQHLQLRIRALQADGYQVVVGRMEAPLPAFSVFIQSAAKPLTGITAAADFDGEAALSQALAESEGRAAQALVFPAAPLRSASAVRSTEAASNFFRTPRFYKRADFFALSPGMPITFEASCKAVLANNWSGLQQWLRAAGLRLIAVDVTPPGASIHQGRTPINVQRALIPGLIPIWFGYGTHPGAMPNFVNAARKRPRSQRTPAHFIHPFT